MVVIMIVMVIIMVVVMFLALHINATMKVAVRLMDHCRTDRGLRIAERNGKRVVALHNLRQTRDAEAPEN